MSLKCLPDSLHNSFLLSPLPSPIVSPLHCSPFYLCVLSLCPFAWHISPSSPFYSAPFKCIPLFLPSLLDLLSKAICYQFVRVKKKRKFNSPLAFFPPSVRATSSLWSIILTASFISSQSLINGLMFINDLSLSFFLCLSAAAGIVRKKQWCEMVPCLEDEGCDLLVNKSGWTCTQPGGRVKTTTVSSASVAQLHNS